MPGLEGAVIKNYHIKDLLGRGGMAEVYLAYDAITEQDVAIKIMTGYSTSDLQRFRREAAAIDKLHHAHILPALDYEEHDSWPYLVMAYAPGGTLRDLLDDGALNAEEAGGLLEQIASAIQFAHDNGVLHRDIKPSNILLRDRSYAYLADFGLAKIIEADREITRTGVLMGTPEYMAPDLADGPATISTDVYALGVLLYQMLAGRVPFDGETGVKIFWKHLCDKPTPPSIYNPTISRAVEHVVLHALEKDPQRRYRSAQALSEAYQKALTSSDPLTESTDFALAEIYEPAYEERRRSMVSSLVEPEEVRVEEAKSQPVPMLAPVQGESAQGAQPRRKPGNPIAPVRRFMTSHPAVRSPRARRIVRRPHRVTPTPEPLQIETASAPASSQVEVESEQPVRYTEDLAAGYTSAYSAPEAVEPAQPRQSRIPRRAHLVSRTKTRSSRRQDRIVWGIVGLGLLCIIVLPLSYIYYLYATQPAATTIVTGPVTSSGRIIQPSSQSSPATNLAAGNLILADGLTNNNYGRWSEAPGSCVFTNGSYHVIRSQSSAAQPCALISPLMTDAAVQVSVSLLSGDTAGILLRLQGNQFYDFEINRQGQFFFQRHDAGASDTVYTTLIKPTASSAIVSGSGKNTLLVFARGGDFHFYINGIFVGQAHDTHYQSGQLAFTNGPFLSTDLSIASFSNFKLSQIAA